MPAQLPAGSPQDLLGAGPATRSGSGGLLPAFANIDDSKLIELDGRLKTFFDGYNTMVRGAMTELASGLHDLVAQESPYWTGHLRRYHIWEVSQDLSGGLNPFASPPSGAFAGLLPGPDKTGDWMGIVAVDPDAPPHPIIGGFPHDYGARLHQYRDAWFETGLRSPQFQGMLGALGAEVVDYYSSKFFDPAPFVIVASGSYTGGQWVDTETIPF